MSFLLVDNFIKRIYCFIISFVFFLFCSLFCVYLDLHRDMRYLVLPVVIDAIIIIDIKI